MRFAIQGGPGSFSAEAGGRYADDNDLTLELDYRYTSENVLTAVEEGSVEQGLIAIENATGGVVYESIEALAEHRCRILHFLNILVVHALLVRPGTSIDTIECIISHPQALKQCEDTLATRFADIPTEVGKGEAVDQATAAKQLAEGKLPATTAVLASRVCADLYNLEIVAENLQDIEENYTTFLVVESL
ncbi:MAG: prephenate dehydratase domain-containing protein [Candidatus Paceibacterota bacterium]